jgi:hypothetical protein
VLQAGHQCRGPFAVRGLGAGHNEFHSTQAQQADRLGDQGAGRARLDDVEDVLMQMRISADRAADGGVLSPGQQATIANHLATGWAATRSGDLPRVRELEALRTLHQRYAPPVPAAERLRLAEERMGRAQVALGLQVLRQNRTGQSVEAAVVTERAEAKRELARARAALAAQTPCGRQQCPACGQWMAAGGHNCPLPEGATRRRLRRCAR